MSAQRRSRASALAALALLWVATLALPSCAGRPAPSQWQAQQARKNEITALWTQIRDWRREAGMGVDPNPTVVFAMSRETATAADQTCPYQIPNACGDVCNLADAICDNAESICAIADELGDDPWARGKCDNAKASCREARQRCCECAAHDTAR